jgi:hypothetical protein
VCRLGRHNLPRSNTRNRRPSPHDLCRSAPSPVARRRDVHFRVGVSRPGRDGYRLWPQRRDGPRDRRAAAIEQHGAGRGSAASASASASTREVRARAPNDGAHARGDGADVGGRSSAGAGRRKRAGRTSGKALLPPAHEHGCSDGSGRPGDVAVRRERVPPGAAHGRIVRGVSSDVGPRVSRRRVLLRRVRVPAGAVWATAPAGERSTDRTAATPSVVVGRVSRRLSERSSARRSDKKKQRRGRGGRESAGAAAEEKSTVRASDGSSCLRRLARGRRGVALQM